MAEAVAGGNTKELFAMMKRGELDPNTALPKFFAILEQKAAQGWQGYTDTTRFQQNITNKRFEDQLMLFGAAGGENAFFRIWKTFADTLPQTNELVKALAGAFQGFARGVEGAGKILVLFNGWMKSFNELTPEVKDGLETLGLAALMLGTRLGRAFMPLTAAFLILEDIATYRQGGKSIAMGVDYEKNSYGGAPTYSKFEGQPFGGVLDQAIRENMRNDTFGSRVKVGALSGLSAFGSIFQKAGQGIGSGLGYMSNFDIGINPNFKYGENSIIRMGNFNQLTPSAQIDAISNQLAFGGQVPSMISPKAQGSTYHLTVQTNSDDPQQHGMLIFRTLQNMSTQE
jgi:hypothetical protein